MSSNQNFQDSQASDSYGKRSRSKFTLDELIADLGLRQPISSYDVNIQDTIRRKYLQNGFCQPVLANFSQTQIGNKARRFKKIWLNYFYVFLVLTLVIDLSHLINNS
ncbi:hypothetical protein KSP39_PZI021913 [Platanthera zijinensis]|uniref:Uncharacterized protein n=1 Tax=Platanthera zijinensis TaxID=2320716 RepID=A0AAP0FWK0_9ASPA